MLKFIIRRVLGFIPVLLSVAAITFFLAQSIPGGPFDFVGDKSLPESVVKNLEAKYHLDWPQWKQFISYMIGDEMKIGPITLYDLDPDSPAYSFGVLRGDLGPSFRYRGQSVNDIIRTTFPLSAQLGLLSMLLGFIIGLPAGVAAALRQNTWLDYTATLIAVLGLSVPNLVLAPILIWIFSVELGWLPAASWGAKPPYMQNMLSPGFDWIRYAQHAFLPVFTLGTALSAVFARLTRASLLQIIKEDYIRTARAKGLKEQFVIYRHALRNSLIPVVTVIGPMFAGLVTGTLIVEQFFGLNGMGKHFVQSITNRDYAVILGTILIYSVILVISNLLVDLMYGWLDPRIRFD
jgi:oligopeptide transport system permease protein